ncbi:unnamed protein product [Linum trigynum]|uniref:Uncharacterized protein n=1 Tax=Linum trigynum TaxID=586398 RepID=A0AAV2GGG3_9ROSI
MTTLRELDIVTDGRCLTWLRFRVEETGTSPTRRGGRWLKLHRWLIDGEGDAMETGTPRIFFLKWHGCGGFSYPGSDGDC